MLGSFGDFDYLLLAFALFPALARLILFRASSSKWPAMAILGVVSSLFLGAVMGYRLHFTEGWWKFFVYAAAFFVIYFLIVLVSYLTLGQSSKTNKTWWLAYLTPIAGLLVARDMIPYAIGHEGRVGSITFIFVGVSYVAFRLCQTVSEVRNETVPMPTIAQYLGYAFFTPILIVGPISPYQQFLASAETAKQQKIDYTGNFLRILKGLIQFLVLSTMLSELTYGPAFLLNGHMHSKLDLVIAVLVYPIFLYCNFSGLCDIAIASSALVGVSIIENFQDPFASRNFQEFWSRWHMSLSGWMRDMVFTPVVKAISRSWKVPVDHAIAVAIMLVFILIGAWHGLETHFILFGISQGIGVVAVHYGGVILKRKLSREKLSAYRKNRFILNAGRVATYLYFAVTLSLFANSVEELQWIFRHLS